MRSAVELPGSLLRFSKRLEFCQITPILAPSLPPRCPPLPPACLPSSTSLRPTCLIRRSTGITQQNRVRNRLQLSRYYFRKLVWRAGGSKHHLEKWSPAVVSAAHSPNLKFANTASPRCPLLEPKDFRNRKLHRTKVHESLSRKSRKAHGVRIRPHCRPVRTDKWM